ncbi:MAG: hypothetical protein AMXMBFR20_15170 [Planctomycetia bacterium]
MIASTAMSVDQPFIGIHFGLARWYVKYGDFATRESRTNAATISPAAHTKREEANTTSDRRTGQRAESCSVLAMPLLIKRTSPKTIGIAPHIQMANSSIGTERTPHEVSSPGSGL